MLDIKLIREDPEPFRRRSPAGAAERVDELLAADDAVGNSRSASALARNRTEPPRRSAGLPATRSRR
jgi:hypothetical protein